MSEFHYPGGELDDFARARNWKAYWMAQVRPFLGTRVLEVGAGIGANTVLLCNANVESWVCLEPDAKLAARLRERIAASAFASRVTVRESTIQGIDASQWFDTVIYVDVLEHIEDDASELRDAASLLTAGGRVIVLSPAHQWLYSPFDAAIGHYRRYSAGMLRAFSIAGMRLLRLRYLDAAGLTAALANRCLLRQSLPTNRQVTFWDRVLVPCSRVLDALFAYRVGKSILAVWEKA